MMKIDEKLALDPKNESKIDISKEFMMQIARAGLLDFGSTSCSYLMRKLKVSESMAKEIVNEIRRD